MILLYRPRRKAANTVVLNAHSVDKRIAVITYWYVLYAFTHQHIFICTKQSQLYCLKSTFSPFLQTKHFRRIHLKEKHHLCQYCDYQAYNKREVVLHEQRVHLSKLYTHLIYLLFAPYNFACFCFTAPSCYYRDFYCKYSIEHVLNINTLLSFYRGQIVQVSAFGMYIQHNGQ